MKVVPSAASHCSVAAVDDADAEEEVMLCEAPWLDSLPNILVIPDVHADMLDGVVLDWSEAVDERLKLPPLAREPVMSC
jgi:hypothetical protein